MEILIRQYDELKHNPLSDLGYDISNIDIHKDFYTWRISLLGAKDTSYADGIFLIKIIFPYNFPNEAPKIFFLTPIYHPNVRKDDGFVGVNFIYEWKPITAREILIKLYGIFYLTNPESPYSGEQAHEFKYNRYLYELKVKYFTKKYANIKSFENIKNSDKYYFSFSLDDLKILKPPEPLEITINNNKEEIELIFEVNNLKQKWHYYSEEKTDDAFKRFISANKIEELNILFIYDRRKLNMNKTLRNNGLKDQSLITVITGVHF